MGQPRKVATPEEFDRLVEEYRLDREVNQKPILMTGMARYLGFASRQSFFDYGKAPEFAYSVARAKLLVEEEYESKLHGPNPTGGIFGLKNMGWTDKQELDHRTPDGPLEVSVTRRIVDAG